MDTAPLALFPCRQLASPVRGTEMQFFLSCLSFGSGRNFFRPLCGFSIDCVQFALDLPVDVALRILGSNTNSILNGVSGGCAVAADGDAAHPQQWRAAVVRVVQAFLEIIEGTAGKQKSDLASHSGIQTFFHHAAYGL